MLDYMQKKYLIDLIKNNEPVPEDMKYLLFPTLKEEYELTYAGKMRKEDLLANQDGTFPIPLQIDRIFTGNNYEDFEDDWKNMIVYGDNLQFLKNIYENKDPLIKDKIKGKVKLIYIDPPFATEREFRNKDDARAYSDGKSGAEFIEFLRRRLILAKEILADDGSIYVQLDYKMGHYGKIVLDEVFGKHAFKADITWEYQGSWVESAKNYPRRTQNIYFYSKGDPSFNTVYEEEKTSQGVIARWSRYLDDGKIYGKNAPYNDGKFSPYLKKFKKEYGREPKEDDIIVEFEGRRIGDMWYVPTVNPMAKENMKYPTQKPEALLERIIKTSTNEGDIVLDFFGGSGTTMAVSEKLNRKWITCDLGKLAYFTMQKRLLKISDSKSLENNQRYGKIPKSFMTCKLGMYDLKQTLEMGWEKYKEFVSQLFEFEKESKVINGVSFEGNKRGFPVKIFNYEEHSESSIDQTYLENLLNSLGSSSPARVYIISPATRVNFIADYEEISDTRFYFLKVPYEMIQELHKSPFVKLRQPRSKSNVNEIEEMKGFQFINKPEVSCFLVGNKQEEEFIVDMFKSYSIQQGEINDFSTLSSIYVDFDNNNQAFIMDDVRFWNEIESESKKHKDTSLIKLDDNITKIIWSFPKGTLGKDPVFILSDIYGNDITIKPTRKV